MLKNVEIVLENCEVITIPAEDFEYLSIQDVKESCYIHSSSFRVDKISSDIHMAIKDSANILENYPSMTFEEQTQLPFDRLLNYADITQIHFKFEDKNESYVVYVDWHDEDEYSNRYQKGEFEDGQLIIIINEENSL